MDETYLHIKDLHIKFCGYEGEKDVLYIEDLQIQKGEAFGLIGESGTGKTVLAYAIQGLLQMPPGKIASGQIILDGQDLLQLSQKELRSSIRGHKIAMIFQDPMSTLNPVFTVEQQMINVIQRNQGLSKKAANEEAVKTIEMVKLPDPTLVMKKYPHELSGGQRQRIIIALALCCKAELLIADEPTRNLDVTIQAGIIKLLQELQDELQVTVLFIANNPGLIYSTCRHCAILYKGQIIESGTVEEVLKEPAHPYTNVLLHAIPEDKGQQIALDKLTADRVGPTIENPCIYYRQCAYACETCTDMESMRHIGGEHRVRCNRGNA